MKRLIKGFLFLLLGFSLAIAGCAPTSIGKVLKLTATVEAGPSSALVVVNNSVPLSNGDRVRVSGGHGRARLSLVNGTITIELYDATNSTTSSTSVSGAANVMAYLSQGGLTATVKEGSTCTVQVPNGGTFYILGTEAFIIYNPETGFTTAGNFSGTVNYDSTTGKDQPLPAGMMVDIGPGGVSVPPYPLPFDMEQFDAIVTQVGSPLDTMNILRDRYNLPHPEQQTQPEFQPQPLFTYEGDKMLPGLASEWSMDGSIDSGKETWTFFLRRDLRLANGEPLTAPLIAKTIMEKASPQALFGVEIAPLDELTLRIEFFQGADRSLLQELPAIKFDVLR